LKLPAHRAELPGKEMTRHGAPGYLRRRIIHPHPNPLPSREREIRGRDLSEAPPVKT